MSFALFLTTCQKSTELENKRNDFTETTCEIEREIETVLRKIFNDHIVAQNVSAWYKGGIEEIFLETDLLIASGSVKSGKLEIRLSNNPAFEKDLIFNLSKENCSTGNFFFTTVTKQFSIVGTVKKSNDHWTVKILKNVEL